MSGYRFAERLARLAEHGSAARVFGADTHRYFLCSPLSGEALADFEARAGISLPTGYRRFVGEVASGGVGPGYGLRWLGAALLPAHDDPEQWAAVADSMIFDTAERQAWSDANLSREVPPPLSMPDFLPPSARSPSPMHSERVRFVLGLGREMRDVLRGDALTDLRTAFALQGPLNAEPHISEIDWGALDPDQTESELQRLWELVDFDRAYAGSLPLCSYGHGVIARLVVVGVGVGSVWIVDQENLLAAPFGPDSHDLHGPDPRPPCGADFESWLSDWLTQVEHQLRIDPAGPRAPVA